MNNRYVVYMHINKNNNMKYIGQTCQKPPEKRWNHGKGYKDNEKFFNAIQKYGWDNFEHIILKKDLTAQQADEYETYYIEYYKTCSRDKGYSLHTGGSHHTITEETREKMRRAHLGYKQTEAAKRKNSLNNIGKHNRFHTEEEKRKISEKQKKQVICINTGEKFNSIGEAAQWCGLKRLGNISQVCKDYRKTAGKHPITKEPLIWKFVKGGI